MDLLEYNINFRSCGYQKCHPNYKCGPGVRDVYIIHYVISGKGTYIYNNVKYEITKGQSFFIMPNTVIEYCADANDPWEYTWLEFSGSDAYTLLSETGLTSYPIGNADFETLPELFRQLCENFDILTPEKKLFSDAAALQIISFYIKNRTDVSSFKTNGELDNVLQYISSNYHLSTLTVDGIAKVMSIDRTTLYRYFKEKLNTTPNKYISELRIQRACKLLKHMDISIKTVAYSVGYSDPLYFSRVFRQFKGISPKEYKSKFTIVS